jgi:hypothetical protein
MKSTTDMKQYNDSLLSFVRGEVNPRSPNFDTRKDEAKQLEIDAEAKRLLANPIELEDADIEKVLGMYGTHQCDLLEFAETAHRYFKKLAKEQAEELHE